MTQEADRATEASKISLLGMISKYAELLCGDLPPDCRGLSADELLERATELADEGNVPLVATLINEGLIGFFHKKVVPNPLSIGYPMLTALESGRDLRVVSPSQKMEYGDDAQVIRAMFPQLQNI